MTIKECVKKYTVYLKNITHIPAKEVEILIMHLLDKNVIWLHLNYDKAFTKELELEKLVKKRATNFPLEYIIKKASFYGEQFFTSFKISKAFSTKSSVSGLGIGTGSGIISVMLATLLKDKNIDFIAVDINPKAIELARKNAKKFEVLERIDFRLSNLFENVKEDDIFMLISNPPYIANDYKLPKNVEFEPSNALFGGVVGDELLKNIIDGANSRKIPYVLCEMGFDQKKSLEEYFKEFNVEFYSFYKDYEKFDRGFTLKFK